MISTYKTKWLHLKTNNVYIRHEFMEEVGLFGVTNTTNVCDGQEMVLYSRNGAYYVREYNEFIEKFSLVTTPMKHYGKAICRGSIALGTGCGKCDKCLDELKDWGII